MMDIQADIFCQPIFVLTYFLFTSLGVFVTHLTRVVRTKRTSDEFPFNVRLRRAFQTMLFLYGLPYRKHQIQKILVRAPMVQIIITNKSIYFGNNIRVNSYSVPWTKCYRVGWVTHHLCAERKIEKERKYFVLMRCNQEQLLNYSKHVVVSQNKKIKAG